MKTGLCSQCTCEEDCRSATLFCRRLMSMYWRVLLLFIIFWMVWWFLSMAVKHFLQLCVKVTSSWNIQWQSVSLLFLPWSRAFHFKTLGPPKYAWYVCYEMFSSMYLKLGWPHFETLALVTWQFCLKSTGPSGSPVLVIWLAFSRAW